MRCGSRIKIWNLANHKKTWNKEHHTLSFQFFTIRSKGHLILFTHFIDMWTTINLSISCRKNAFLLKFSNKNTVFLHEMDKLTSVLMSIKWLNKIERPLAFWRCLFCFFTQFARFQISICEPQRIWWKLLELSWLYYNI